MSLITEIRSAVRGLRRSPAVAGSAILCIALGIGATAAIASAINRALLQRLPFREPERLVTVYRTTPHFDTGPFSAPNFRDLATSSRRLGALAAATPRSGLLSAGAAEAMRVSVYRVTGSFFPLLGARPLYGRFLTPEDDAPGQPDVVVMSAELWRERFGADPGVVGRVVRLDGVPHTVVGVAPTRFKVPHGTSTIRAQLWVPIRFTPDQLGQRRSNYLQTFGRLAPGATPELAHAELRQLFDGVVARFPELRGEQVRVLPMQAEGTRSVRTPLLLVFGAVCMVLLIAATNVASLLLARGVQRRREMAVRVAIGGTRGQVMRPVLLESLVIAAVGLALGLGLAAAGVRTIGALAARRLPQLDGLGVDWRIVVFAVLLAVVVAMLCAAVPAWRGTAVDPQDALRGGRGGGAGRAHHRALSTLVVAEVALSLVLLIGAGLVLKGFARLLEQDPGFDPKPILTLEASVVESQYPDWTALRRFVDPALARIREVPGVEAAAATMLVPYTNWGWNFNVRYEGQPKDDPTQRPLVEVRAVTPEFFAVTGQRLLEGRLLTAADDERPGAPAVVVVNEALAKRDFTGRSAVGRRFHWRSDTSFATIVGVVSDIKNFGPYEPAHPEAYWTYAQARNGSASSFPIMVRLARGDPERALPAIRAALRAVDPAVAVTNVAPMTEVIQQSVGEPRFYLTLLATFAAVAVVLAVAGIYGVLSYAVAQRTRELGIRSALGSTSGQLVALVTRQGMGLVGAGVVLGLAGGALVTRFLQSMLYDVSPLDAPTWALATLALAAIGFVAALVPARRASRTDPLVAIRTE